MALLIYDIGMHKGEDSEFYLKKGFAVVAVDADPLNCEMAAQRLAEFVRSGQLKILNLAISNRPGRAIFFRSEKSDWGTLLSQWDEQNRSRGFASERVTVESVTLADLVHEHGDPYFIKIDIEGMDQAALASLAKIPTLPKFISIEMSYPRDARFRTAKAEVTALTDLGYDRFKIVPQHTVESQMPPNPPREGTYVPHRFEFGASGLFGEESPGEWQTAADALRSFRRIMLRHLPEAQLYRNQGLHDAFIRLRQAVIGRPEQPYWYDIHARLSEARSA